MAYENWGAAAARKSRDDKSKSAPAAYQPVTQPDEAPAEVAPTPES